MIEGHGDDLYRYGDKVRYNFSSNIFQGVDHSDLREHLAASLTSMNNYPEPAPYTIERMLAQRLGAGDECIMVTNGATDAIHIIAREYQSSKTAVIQPTFAEYADACRISDHEVIAIKDPTEIPKGMGTVWLCNPNNPNGRVYPVETLLSAIDQHPDTIFVIDQAYYKYTHAQTLNPTDAADRDNLILVYSMTKDYAIPGLRLGYVVAYPTLITRLKRYRTPWSVNSIAQEAAKYLLSKESDESVKFDLDMLLSEAKRVSRELQKLGIKVEPTQTNFFLCELPENSADMRNSKGSNTKDISTKTNNSTVFSKVDYQRNHNGCTAAQLKEYLVREHGILIRDASNFETLTPRHFRIAVQSPYENDQFINALKKWMLL